MKRFLFSVAFSLAVTVGKASDTPYTYVLTCEPPMVSLESRDDGCVVPVTADTGWMMGLDKPGAPAVPRRTYLFAAPDGMSFDALDCEIAWETLAEGVRLAPQPEPVRDGEETPATPCDPLAYDVEVYPANAAVTGACEKMDGVTVVPVTVASLRWSPRTGHLERARDIVLRVTFKADASAVSRAWSESHRASVCSAVANPEAVESAVAPVPVASRVSRVTRTLRLSGMACAVRESVGEEPGLYRTDPETNAIDYLLLAPPDFYDDWCWYVRQRRETHGNLRFAVKNTSVVYAEHPFGKGLACRNAAESLHAYLRHTVSNGVRYVVLGGAWLDAQNLNGYTPYFANGEVMSLSNCVPGVYAFPRENWRQIPADLFYGCLDMDEKKGQQYPWDLNGDGKYLDQADCQYNDTYPDVCVSRITLNPHSGYGTAFNQHELITNYVDKLARGEARYFAGHYRYGMSVASTGSSKLRKSGDRMYYRELAFYDGMYNMFDPRHHDTLEDGEGSTRERYVNQFSTWRPIRSVKGMMSYTWTGGQPTLSAAMDDYYAGDRDFGYVQAHGWAQGAAQFSAYRFATATGLTLFNGGSGPCETGYPDYHVSSGNRKVLQYNVGDAAVTNPKGGALASVNNSRWSWAGGGGGFAAMSYYMLNEMLIGFNGDRLDVGHAWLKGVRNYWPAGRWGNTAGWVLVEQFLYGDPLVRLPEVPNYTWQGGATGRWDLVTTNWANSVDAAQNFDAASNVYFSVDKTLDLDVAGEIAAWRLSLPARQADAVMSFAGAGTLRVMRAIDVAGTNATLTFDVAGGVGHDGIRFVTGAGDLVFKGTNQFYVGGVSNARRIVLRGGGVTLDADEFAAGKWPIVFEGDGRQSKIVPNELRSKNVGGLTRFGSLAMTNAYVRLSTVDAFGNGEPAEHALVDSVLEIGANVYYQRSGFPEGLNATFAVDGESAVTGAVGGLWTVKHTTTFALGANARLTLGAETANAGGRIVITNCVADATVSNVVEIANAAALSGDVTIGKGIRLVLKELPLASVTSLTLGEGATVVLPDDESGYWQIVPVSSRFNCARDVTFVTAGDPSNALDGSPSPTGSFFKDGALYRWTGTEGDWNVYFANRHPKILFGDLAAADVTVRVATAVSPEFVFFSNVGSEYVFTSADPAASVSFASVYFSGPTKFDVPVYATEYVSISAGTSTFSNVVAPHVQVGAGAGLALAGSHWTEFRLDAGAILVAVEGETLDWNAETSFDFPDDGAVRIDVGCISLGESPTPLIVGHGHEWTLADLTRFELVQTNAELRIADGALCVAKGDGIKGPYELCFAGATNWNCAAWTAAGSNREDRVTLPRIWSACGLDWTADAAITATNASRNELSLDCDVHVQTLTLQAGSNDVCLAAEKGLAALPVLDVVTLDMTGCDGTVDIGVETGAAAILTPTSTNATGVVRLRCSGSGTITLSGGSTLLLDKPGEWTLNRGAQGTLRVIAPQAYERFRIAKVASGFENSGLTIQVTDANGRVIDGFKTSVSDESLWCEPPALEAVVPPGTNDLTRLVWRDMLGNVVSNVDWSAAAGFRLIGATNGVVIAKNGFASVWSRLSVSNDVVLYGSETLAPAQIPSGNGTLVLAGAFTLRANVNASPNLLSGAKLKLLEGTTLEISHRATNYDARSQDWRGITGSGRVVFTDSTSSWIALPSKCFADSLSVETASDIVLTEGYVGNAFDIRNLAGAGLFRSDWGNGNAARPVRTVQTRVSAYTGYLHKKDSRTSTLVVASDDATASTNKALVVSGTAIEEHTLAIEKSGCVILTGTWKGEIKVEGLLVITNACATNAVKVTCVGDGEVKTISPEEVPAVTAPSDYVAPVYQPDPGPSEEEPEEACASRDLTAQVEDDVSGSHPWTSLSWCDASGAAVTDIDWSQVTNATIVATGGNCRVIADAELFSGVARLVGVTLEARTRTPFTLASDSVGAVDFRLHPVPTATCDLLLVTEAANGQTPVTNCPVTVHDRYGREPDVAGEVAYDAAAHKYSFYVQNVDRPNVSNTFDTQYEDTLTSSLGFSGSGGLTYKDWSFLFEPSRSGRAMKGIAKNHFTLHSHNGNPTVGMDNVYVWSINFVVKLPTNNGGIIFGWGNKDSGNGVALVRVRENVAGVYAWENGGAVRLIVSANVPFASSQFHSYAITHDSHTLCLYVDGTLAQTAALEGKYPTRGFYQYFKMYGQNGGLSDGSTAVVDDFRLYLNCCLTPASVRMIAKQFEPWPERPTAVADVTDLAWSNLYWSAECPAGESLELEAGAGSLLLDAPVAVTNPLAVTGGTIPVRLIRDGALIASEGLAATTTLAFDCSSLDGTNLAARAVADVPYARWVMRGAFSGPIEVTALPEVPEGYSVGVETFAAYGIRLVFTAPRYAFADSVGISVGDDDFEGLAGELGLHPTSVTNWHAYATWTNDVTEIGGLRVTGSAGGHADAVEPYGAGATVARYFAHTSFDGNCDDYNGKSNGLSFSGLAARFGTYRVLVYMATDTSGANFGPVTIAGRSYCGLSAGGETSWATVSDSTALAWGKSRVTTAVEGVNVVISDALTNDAVEVSALRLKNNNVYARGQIAAVQFVKVAEIHEFTGSRYAAEVVRTTDWDDGNGAGLVHEGMWRNGPFSSICLTANVACATLAFNTAVTAETMRVVTAPGQMLTLARKADMAVYEYDLSASEGMVRMDGDLHLGGEEASCCVLATGARGTLDIVVDDVTTSRRLMRLATGFDCTSRDFTATVHDAQGREPDESWTVLPVDGWLVLQRLDIEKPLYSLTFEDSLSTSVDGTMPVPLKSEGSPRYVEARGGKRAMTGGTPYSSSEMAYVPGSWTIHAVAQMPGESNGTLFGYGRHGQRGVGILTVDEDNVAVAWWDSRGKFTVINARVPNATRQFHAYALVSTGTSVSLYVDGEFKGRADAPVNPGLPVLQIGSTYGDVVSGFARTTTGAMDDWRLYDGVLSTNAIRTLAAQFRPWPDYSVARVTEAESVWDDLAWDGESDAEHPLLLVNHGETLSVTNVCTLSNVLYATGGALTLRMTEGGRLVSRAGLNFGSAWSIDCSALEATNLTARAAVDAPYVHTLVDGAYTGGDPTILGLPSVSDRYSLVVVADPNVGVSLVISVRADYVAEITHATVWAAGNGGGLAVRSAPWANDASSTITLTQAVDIATLTFDTAVTSRLIRIVTTNAQHLTLAAADGVPLVLARFDLTEAKGTLVISNGVAEGSVIDLGLASAFAVTDGVLDYGTARPTNHLVFAGGKIKLSLSEQEERTYGVTDLIPVPSGAKPSDYIVCSHAGTVLESDWITVEGGILKVDTSGMDLTRYEMPLRGTMTAGKAWAEQAWVDSAVPPQRVPVVYWDTAANVRVVLDIASNVVIAVADCVTNATVTGCGTVVSDGKWPAFAGLADATRWHGTVRIANKTNCKGDDLTGLGNATSAVEMDGVSGWFSGFGSTNGYLGTEHPYTLKIGANGYTVDNGSSWTSCTFAHLAGSGTFSYGSKENGPTMRFVVREAAGFTGRIFVTGNGGVTIGTPAKNPTPGTIVVAADATANVTVDRYWSTVNGFEFAAGSTLNVLASGQQTSQTRHTVTRGNLALPAGAHLTFNGGADCRDFWYVTGGDIVRHTEWSGNVALASGLAAKSIVVTGETTLALTGDGAVAVEDGMKLKAALTIDARGLDGTNIAMCAVAGAPYSRWLVRGSVSGDVTVLAPGVPDAYTIAVETLPAYGVRLVVTANRMARFGAISVNLCQDTPLAASDVTSGLHPVSRCEWANLTIANNAVLAVSNATFTLGGDVSAYHLDKTAPDAIYQQYMDDKAGSMRTLTISGVTYPKYRLIVYYSTDTANVTFQPLVVNDVSYSAQPETGGQPSMTIRDLAAAWGNTGPDHEALSPAEGVNALVTDVLTGSTAMIKATRPNNTTARATISAVQVVKVGVLNEEYIANYAAELAGTVSWRGGDGTGLMHESRWANHPYSSIALIPTAPASLDFDTAVTASVLRVTSAAENTLALSASAAPNVVAALDFSKALGAVTLSNTLGATSIALGADTHVVNDRGSLAFAVARNQRLTLGESLAWQAGDTVAAGGYVRFLGAVAAPQFTTAGAIASYAKATFTGSFAAYNWVLRLDDSTDRVTIYSNDACYLPVDIVAGQFSLGKAGCAELVYGGIKGNTETNSVITVRGGIFTTPVAGSSSTGGNRGLIIGGTGSANRAPRVIIEDGLFSCENGLLSPWEKAAIVQNGGILRAKGIWKGGYTEGALTLSGGVTEIGSLGIARHNNSNGAFAFTLAGGTVKAVESAAISIPVTIAASVKTATLCAGAGKKLTVAAKLTTAAGAALAIGAAGDTGEVAIADATLGDVTVAPGATLTLPLGLVPGNLTLGENATLNLTHGSTYTTVTNLICTGSLSLGANARVLLNGLADMPAYLTREGNVILFTPASQSWLNPVTGAAQSFAYRFTGAASADWNLAANWQKYADYAWQASTVAPMVESSNAWAPAVIDGNGIATPANRCVSLTANMEGWTPRLALYNGVTVTVSKIKKLQSESTAKWFWVDATSQLTISAFGADSYDNTIDLCVASSNGIVFAGNPCKNDATFRYYLKGAGSVRYTANLTMCAHRICCADIQLKEKGFGKAVRSKRLISLAQGGTVSFAWDGVTIAAEDPAGTIVAGSLVSSLADVSDLPVGSCVVTQRTDGVYLEYVDREGDVVEHQFAAADGVSRVLIPYDWIMRLTRGFAPLLATDDMSPEKVTAALNSTAAPNGILPWQSYMLGLDPTNALDDVRCSIDFTGGKIRLCLPNVDPARQPDPTAISYILEHKTLLTDAWTTLVSQTNSHELTVNPPADTNSGFYRYRIILR